MTLLQDSERFRVMILENHGWNTNLRWSHIELMIALGEGESVTTIVSRGYLPWKTDHAIQSKLSELTAMLELREGGRGKANKKPKGWNERVLREFCVTNLDSIYSLYMHVTPSDQDEPDCHEPKCWNLWGKEPEVVAGTTPLA